VTTSEWETAEPVGRSAIIYRLARLESRLDALSDKLRANGREYDGLQDAYRLALSEHERLTTKLHVLDEMPA